jgi:hypothetical protein
MVDFKEYKLEAQVFIYQIFSSYSVLIYHTIADYLVTSLEATS